MRHLVGVEKNDKLFAEANLKFIFKSALKQNYQSKNFDVVVIADSLKPITITKLKALPIKLVEVSFENRC